MILLNNLETLYACDMIDYHLEKYEDARLSDYFLFIEIAAIRDSIFSFSYKT